MTLKETVEDPRDESSPNLLVSLIQKSHKRNRHLATNFHIGFNIYEVCRSLFWVCIRPSVLEYNIEYLNVYICCLAGASSCMYWIYSSWYIHYFELVLQGQNTCFAYSLVKGPKGKIPCIILQNQSHWENQNLPQCSGSHGVFPI